MRAKTKAVLIAGAAMIALAVGTGVGIAASGGDDQPLTGTELERATAAALEHTGGGTVIETEVGDAGAAYGVEVRMPDGGVVEISLDGDFHVIGTQADDDTPGEDETDDTD
jgi:hypothetical protein